MHDGLAKPVDDILLSVITDGRHAAIDLRLVDPVNDNEEATSSTRLSEMPSASGRKRARPSTHRKDGKPFDRSGAGQLIFSDLGTISVVASRGFSAYRWIRDRPVHMGVPASEIAYDSCIGRPLETMAAPSYVPVITRFDDLPRSDRLPRVRVVRVFVSAP